MKNKKNNLVEKIINSTLLAGTLLAPLHGGAVDLGSLSINPSIKVQAIRFSIRDFEVKGLRIINFIPNVLKRQEAYDFFMENPRLALKVNGIDPETVDIGALQRAVYDLAGRYSWWDVTFVSPMRQEYQSKSNSGVETKFDPSWHSKASSSSKYGSKSSWDGEDTVDKYIEQLASWKDEGAGFLPLITSAVLDRIMIRSALTVEDFDDLKIAPHHASNLEITRLIGDLSMDHEAREAFGARPGPVLKQYGLSVFEVEPAMVVKAAENVAAKVGYQDKSQCERYPDTNIPIWFSDREVMDAITVDLIASVESQQGLTFNPSGLRLR